MSETNRWQVEEHERRRKLADIERERERLAAEAERERIQRDNGKGR